MSSIGEILKKYSNLFPLDKGGKGDLNYLDIELIISNVIKKPRAFLLAHPEHKLRENYELRIKNYAARRMSNEPLAYILGQKEFYGFNFKVNKNVLVPRPETEMIIDHATHSIERITKNKKTIFIDVGTGSGCIIITLAKKLLNNELRIMNYEFIGIDISESALKIARQNAKFHKVDKKIKFLKGNLLEPLLKNKKLKIVNCKLIIAANLPYLTPAQIKNSPSIQYEPKIALNAGRDGLKHYRELFSQIKKIKKICVTCYVLCEIDPAQTLKIKKIIKNNFPDAKVEIKKDPRGLSRLVVAEV
jgi:release factor glutamine methyltransferase